MYKSHRIYRNSPSHTHSLSLLITQLHIYTIIATSSPVSASQLLYLYSRSRKHARARYIERRVPLVVYIQFVARREPPLRAHRW